MSVSDLKQVSFANSQMQKVMFLIQKMEFFFRLESVNVILVLIKSFDTQASFFFSDNYFNSNYTVVLMLWQSVQL